MENTLRDRFLPEVIWREELEIKILTRQPYFQVARGGKQSWELKTCTLFALAGWGFIPSSDAAEVNSSGAFQHLVFGSSPSLSRQVLSCCHWRSFLFFSCTRCSAHFVTAGILEQDSAPRNCILICQVFISSSATTRRASETCAANLIIPHEQKPSY